MMLKKVMQTKAGKIGLTLTQRAVFSNGDHGVLNSRLGFAFLKKILGGKFSSIDKNWDIKIT